MAIISLVDSKLPTQETRAVSLFIISKVTVFSLRLTLVNSNMFTSNTILSGLGKKLLPPYIKNKIHIT